MKIAMWSGPRNLSTALMYAFAARTDCAVVDEPFYAAYLAISGHSHPMRDEILESQPNNPNVVTQTLLDTNPGNKEHFYQKHMTHHMVPGIDRTWMRQVYNVFLIRHPARVIASYDAKRETPTLDDIGFRQQAELFDHAVALGQSPIVLDAADIRKDPQAALKGLCAKLGIEFQAQMLAWPGGGNAADGVWARHWYKAVHRSTGFAGPENDLPALMGNNAQILDQAMPYYAYLKARI